MKKTIRLLSLFIISLLLWQRISAFTDINPNSALHKYVESALRRRILDDGGFFRSSASVPAEMFWKVVLRDAQFNPDSATFHTPLPPNIALKIGRAHV